VSSDAPEMPDSKYKPPYTFSTHIGAACATKMRTFPDLAEKLKIDVIDLMRQCNGPPGMSRPSVRSWRGAELSANWAVDGAVRFK